jgi:hypothetical protein
VSRFLIRRLLLTIPGRTGEPQRQILRTRRVA